MYRKYKLLIVIIILISLISFVGCKSKNPTGPNDSTPEGEDKDQDDLIAEEPPLKEDDDPAKGNDDDEDEDTESLPEEEFIYHTENIEYVNRKYGFNLLIPNSWKNKFELAKGDWAGEAEEIIDFIYTPNKQNMGLIFSILILKPEYDLDYIEEGPWNYIDTNKDRVFAYIISQEPSEELLEPENEDLLLTISDMINEDLPDIIESVSFTE